MHQSDPLERVKSSSSKYRSISRGKLSDRKFVTAYEEIPTIWEKSVTSLGRWYDVDMNDDEQVAQFRKDVAEGLDRIEKSVSVCPVGVGERGFVARSAVSLVGELGVRVQSLRKTVKKMSGEYLFLTCGTVIKGIGTCNLFLSL